jgi:glycosyltransferase involved in cell wall biosynthesis
MCEFPEVRNFNEFKKREHYFQHCLTPAYVVLADSEQLASDIARRYGIDRERLLPMPFAPASFLKSKSALEKAAVLKKYELNEGYYFYPGQFWAHKNHIRILEALIHLRKTGFNFQVVFVGGDQGNQKYIESIVAKENLEGQVRFLGFVPMDDMRGLYEGSVAIVMPTYFGPTNLPPLEAWMVGKPLIYSSHLKDQVGDAAICVNPDDAEELANAMHACTVPETCKELIRSGESKLQEIENVRKNAERELLLRMQKFEIRRRCWL